MTLKSRCTCSRVKLAVMLAWFSSDDAAVSGWTCAVCAASWLRPPQCSLGLLHVYHGLVLCRLYLLGCFILLGILWVWSNLLPHVRLFRNAYSSFWLLALHSAGLGDSRQRHRYSPSWYHNQLWQVYGAPPVAPCCRFCLLRVECPWPGSGSSRPNMVRRLGLSETGAPSLLPKALLFWPLLHKCTPIFWCINQAHSTSRQILRRNLLYLACFVYKMRFLLPTCGFRYV